MFYLASGPIFNFYSLISDKLYETFIKDERYLLFIHGFVVTMEITAMALLLGLFLGVITGITKLQGKKPYTKGPNFVMSVLSNLVVALNNTLVSIVNLYVTIIRGTPMIVQLLVIYFIFFANSSLPKVIVVTIAFGINSGAYVAEIIRAGIQAVDRGQMEAGRSLGLSYGKTMFHVIIPQAVKNILPALGNEAIILVKETSIAGYIGVVDLTKGATAVVAATYESYTPFFFIAYIYLLITMILSYFLSLYERRLRRSD